MKSLLYTRTGDKGQTSLATGRRVLKTDLRVVAYGNIDELNAHVGVLHAACSTMPREVLELLEFISLRLFDMGAYLASDIPDGQPARGIDDEAVNRLEAAIDAMDGACPRLNAFVLPLGAPPAAQAHVCRVVCRRAERKILLLAQSGAFVDDKVLAFVNRLSDYLFILSRYINVFTQTPEITWHAAK